MLRKFGDELARVPRGLRPDVFSDGFVRDWITLV
jgi:hypothetical protein